MLYDALPSELTRHKAWLVWQFKQLEDGKKPLKIPRYTDGAWRKGTQGSREDRQKLATFEVALSTMEKSKGRYKGLGFALMPEWGLVAVDFDDCVVDGEVMPAVAELVEPTYWEFSPSGNGIRAFFKGHMRDAKSLTKEARAKRGGWGVEFFCSNGFVTITGNVAPEVEMVGPDIVPLTPAIMALYDEACGSKDANVENSNQPIVGMNDDEIKRMLESWDADCDYMTWLYVGMAIHHETQGEGFDLWHDWSARGSKYDGEQDCQYRWESFGREGKKSLKTIRWMINEKGLDFTLENAIGVGELGGKLLSVPIDPRTGKSAVLGRPKYIGMTEKTGEIPGSVYNTNQLLRHPHLTGFHIGGDVFRDEVMLRPYGTEGHESWMPLRDTFYNVILEDMDKRGFKQTSKDKVRDGIKRLAAENEFDSAQLWLTEVVPAWDGVVRVERLLADYMGCEDNDYTRAVSRYVMTAHAGRVLNPGVKADMMPVLISAQGFGKSSGIEALVPGEEQEFFTRVDFKKEDEVNVRRTRGKLIVECAELRGLGGRDRDSIKEYLDRKYDEYRKLYEENMTKTPRRFLFWGTSNNREFLSDPTGNRRFLPLVMVDKVDVEQLKKVREQLWAEAREMYREHGVMWQEADALAEPYRNKAFKEDDWLELVEEFLEGKDEKGRPWAKHECIRADDLYTNAINLLKANRNNKTHNRLQTVMSRLGYIRDQRRLNGENVRGFWKINNEEEGLL